MLLPITGWFQPLPWHPSFGALAVEAVRAIGPWLQLSRCSACGALAYQEIFISPGIVDDPDIDLEGWLATAAAEKYDRMLREHEPDCADRTVFPN